MEYQVFRECWYFYCFWRD
ncbi:hypothetical protein MP638_001699 [Amoeboaphelidium occidentale]|nr:hypothetical protein MP638_001699 [Amoeboaphelidium occidentale]